MAETREKRKQTASLCTRNALTYVSEALSAAYAIDAENTDATRELHEAHTLVMRALTRLGA